MDIGTAKTILARMSYKPGFSITASNNQYIDVSGSFHDVTGRICDPTTFTFSLKVCYQLIHTEEQLLHMVHQCIRRWEEHELDEWFKIDGKKVYDPHALV